MENCDSADFDRCEVKKGETVTGKLTFKASKATSSLKCAIFGVVGGIPLPFPGKKAEAFCKNKYFAVDTKRTSFSQPFAALSDDKFIRFKIF
jgi:hypothetical protein